jgi:hypothetical protein
VVRVRVRATRAGVRVVGTTMCIFDVVDCRVKRVCELRRYGGWCDEELEWDWEWEWERGMNREFGNGNALYKWLLYSRPWSKEILSIHSGSNQNFMLTKVYRGEGIQLELDGLNTPF